MRDTILAFDLGTKNIGIAVGNYNTSIACPLCVIKVRKGIPNWVLIGDLLSEWKPYEVVIGLPLNMDGTEQPFTLHVRKFARKIHNYFGVNVKLHDERLSTFKAKSMLFEYGGSRVLSKKKVDSVAAMIILESYFTQILN